MNKLRLPGSWKARVQSVAGVAAAAYASSVWALVQGWQNGEPPSLVWFAIVLGGAFILFLGVVALLLHLRGAIEFIGPEEEDALRKRRLLTLGPAGEPIRGSGPPEESDDTPVHVKRLTLAAVLAWGVAVPMGALLDWERAERLFSVWLAVVASVTAAIFFFVHKARTAARVVAEASED